MIPAFCLQQPAVAVSIFEADSSTLGRSLEIQTRFAGVCVEFQGGRGYVWMIREKTMTH